MLYNINHYNIQKILKRKGRKENFLKYPKRLLAQTATITVNSDDYLPKLKFEVCADKRNLPSKIYIYGKQSTLGYPDSDILYCNYWLDSFLNTIENGAIQVYKPKGNTKYELSIGLPFVFRQEAFNRNIWDKKDIIKFLSCLLDVSIKEKLQNTKTLQNKMIA